MAEQATLLHVFIFSIAGGVLSLVGGLFLLSKRSTADILARYATPFAAGSLLSAVFLDILHDGVLHGAADKVFLSALGGVVVFFVLERLLRWFHHHHDHGEEDHRHQHKTSMIVIGDTLHNALDGLAIAASFLVSVPTGIITTFAVAAHEIPQEIGDFGLLLNRGMRRRSVLLVNLISALATVAVAVTAFTIGKNSSLPTEWLIGLSAGFLLYIAMSDLIPSIHEDMPKRKFMDWRTALFLFGVVFVGIAIKVAHNIVDPHVEQQQKLIETSAGSYKWDENVPVPEIDAKVSGSKQAGLMVQVTVTGFDMTPDKDTNPARTGEGHVVMLVDGQVVGRIFSEWTFIPGSLLPEHFDEIEFRLAANTHQYFEGPDGQPIYRTVRMIEDEDHDHDH